MGIVESLSPLEVFPRRGEFTHCKVSRAECPMREAEGSGVIMGFGFG